MKPAPIVRVTTAVLQLAACFVIGLLVSGIAQCRMGFGTPGIGSTPHVSESFHAGNDLPKYVDQN
jgi:hypothetical protein